MSSSKATPKSPVTPLSPLDAKDVPKQNIAVFGGGSFGTAVGTLFARNGHKVTILDRRAERCKHINKNHRNPDYLTDFDLPVNVSATTDPKVALADVDIILHAIPVQGSFAYLKRLAHLIPSDTPIVSLSKGIHCDTLQFMCDIIDDALTSSDSSLSPASESKDVTLEGPGKEHNEEVEDSGAPQSAAPSKVVRAKNPTAFLSGPSFAKELMKEMPTGLVIASLDQKLAVRVGLMICSNRIRIYPSDDVLGVEVGGALKNIYAIGAGVIQGAGFGLNTVALAVTRGCAEMKRLAVAMGAGPDTLNGLSGIGDLMLTCFGPASRNRSVGVRLGEGESLDAIVESMSEVAEGIPTTTAALKLAKKKGIDLPLAQAVFDILYAKCTIEEAMSRLMLAPIMIEA